MTPFAIAALIVWVVASANFARWKRTVAYPKQSSSVRFTTTCLFELMFVGLAVWVIS